LKLYSHMACFINKLIKIQLIWVRTVKKVNNLVKIIKLLVKLYSFMAYYVKN